MISLYGKLARFVKKINSDVDPKQIPCVVHSAGEAIRALKSQFPGIVPIIKKGYYKVVRGNDLFNDKQSISKDQINMSFGEDRWHFLPIAVGFGGGKTGAWLMVIAGAALMVVGLVIGITPAHPVGAALFNVGLGLFLGGLAGLLTPVPEMPESKRHETESYLFNGPLNINEPGSTIPVAYGEVFIGSIVVSHGTKVTQV